jgi:hypothetical protein
MVHGTLLAPQQTAPFAKTITGPENDSDPPLSSKANYSHRLGAFILARQMSFVVGIPIKGECAGEYYGNHVRRA